MKALVHLACMNAVAQTGGKTGGQAILHFAVLLGSSLVSGGAHDVFSFQSFELWLKHTVYETKRTYPIRLLVGLGLGLSVMITTYSSSISVVVFLPQSLYLLFIKKSKNVSCEYDRRVVETQLCKLRDTSDTI